MPYVVMVRCLNADKAVSTGIHCDIKGFSTLAEGMSFDCPECGQVHHWSVTDAWLRDTAYATGELKLHIDPVKRVRPLEPTSFSTELAHAGDRPRATSSFRRSVEQHQDQPPDVDRSLFNWINRPKRRRPA